MLSPDVIKQIRRVQLKAGHLVTDAMAGHYQSAFKGRGMEFDEVREYVPGDDVRALDWNVTARTGQPHVKVLREERELTLMIMVDVSPSQIFGTAGRQKNELAAELAAVLAFLATRNNDKVGLLVFSDHVEQFIPPKKGRGHIWNIIRSVLTHEGSGQGTNISGALDHLMAMMSRRSMCFLISDFWATDYERSLRVAGRRHDLICVKIRDERETVLPDAGLVAFRDSETGETLLVDTGDRWVREAIVREGERRDEEYRRLLARYGVDGFNLTTAESVATPLARYLRSRERRSPRRRGS